MFGVSKKQKMNTITVILRDSPFISSVNLFKNVLLRRNLLHLKNHLPKQTKVRKAQEMFYQ